eukprot:3941932-Pyramimonas_sp.AAC.2
MRALTSKCEGSLEELRACLEVYTGKEEAGADKVAALIGRVNVVEEKASSAATQCATIKGDVRTPPP